MVTPNDFRHTKYDALVKSSSLHEAIRNKVQATVGCVKLLLKRSRAVIRQHIGRAIIPVA